MKENQDNINNNTENKQSQIISSIGKIGSNVTNLFGSMRDKNQNKQQTKLTKIKAKNKLKKDPYQELGIPKGAVNFLSKRSTNTDFKFTQQNFDKKMMQHKEQYTKKIQEADSSEEVEQIEKEEKKEKKGILRGTGRKLQMFSTTESIKRVVEGPHGCVKDFIAFLKISVICLTVVGGALVTGLLKVFGVF